MRDESRKGKPRVVEPQRRQGVIRFEMPEDKLAPTHTARVLWDVIGALDLTAFLDGVKAIEGTVGRKTLSPQMKLTLWLYAISNGVGSAREIARLIASDDGYRWIVGDLEVGHHTLSAFRVNHGAALEQLMTDLLASRMHKGVLSLELVAQDGIRIRAAATAPSFRRLESLLECREQAALHLKATLANADDPELTHGQRAAREAGARDFQRRGGGGICVPAVHRVPRPWARGDRRAAHQAARRHRRPAAPRRAVAAAQYRRGCRSYVASRYCEALHDRPGLGDGVRRDPRRDEDPADDQATAIRAWRRPADQRRRHAHEDDLSRGPTSTPTMGSTSTATATSTTPVKVKAHVGPRRRQPGAHTPARARLQDPLIDRSSLAQQLVHEAPQHLQVERLLEPA